jgi:hypothetical protein
MNAMLQSELIEIRALRKARARRGRDNPFRTQFDIETVTGTDH